MRLTFVNAGQGALCLALQNLRYRNVFYMIRVSLACRVNASLLDLIACGLLTREKASLDFKYRVIHAN